MYQLKTAENCSSRKQIQPNSIFGEIENVCKLHQTCGCSNSIKIWLYVDPLLMLVWCSSNLSLWKKWSNEKMLLKKPFGWGGMPSRHLHQG